MCSSIDVYVLWGWFYLVHIEIQPWMMTCIRIDISIAMFTVWHGGFCLTIEAANRSTSMHWFVYFLYICVMHGAVSIHEPAPGYRVGFTC